jgi:hypothetical protein
MRIAVTQCLKKKLPAVIRERIKYYICHRKIETQSAKFSSVHKK